jgi:hypothetical protein
VVRGAPGSRRKENFPGKFAIKEHVWKASRGNYDQ